jgi:hypothetical protein
MVGKIMIGVRVNPSFVPVCVLKSATDLQSSVL